MYGYLYICFVIDTFIMFIAGYILRHSGLLAIITVITKKLDVDKNKMSFKKKKKTSAQKEIKFWKQLMLQNQNISSKYHNVISALLNLAAILIASAEILIKTIRCKVIKNDFA